GGARRRAGMAAGDLPSVARVALVEGAAGLARFSVRLVRAVLPMRAQTAEDAADAMARLGRAALEFKLDGARVQLHKRDDEVKVYSRSLKDVTAAVPELVERARLLPARELILDGEAITLRPDGTPLPFQTTMRRFGRRLDVERLRRDLPLTPFFFDLLYLDGGPRGLALESASRCARPRDRRRRHAGEDVQGHDRRDARVADQAAARAGDRAGRVYGPCPSGARRGSRFQRRTGEPALCRWPGAALRAGQALSPGQDRRRGGYRRNGTADPRAQSRPGRRRLIRPALRAKLRPM